MVEPAAVDEAASLERVERRRRVAERRNRLRREVAAEDGGAVEDVPLGRVEAVEPARDQRLHGGRGIGEASALGSVGEEAARRTAGFPRRARRRVAASRRSASRHREGRRRARARRRRGAARGRAACRAPAASPTPAAARRDRAAPGREQDERRGRAPARDVLDQVEQRRVRPVPVLDHDDERPPPGERLEEEPQRPVRLSRRCSLGHAGHLGDAARDRRALGLAGDDGRDRVGVDSPERVPEQLDDRLVRRPRRTARSGRRGRGRCAPLAARARARGASCRCRARPER